LENFKSNDCVVLDCTLRDGGYYVNWDFNEDLVRRYLSAMVSAKVDVIEIGFRFLSVDRFYGAFAFSTDSYLKTINLPKNISIAVMINFSEILKYSEGVYSAINRLFSYKKDSPVSIVRIAINLEDVDKCYEASHILKNLGYKVFINIMQIDNVDEKVMVQAIRDISNWFTTDVLYVADSFGSMSPTSIKKTIKTIKSVWRGSIGIHAHDNKGLALLNSISAIENGAKYVDMTVLGMGRGAGNTKTEYFLMELTSRGYDKYSPDFIFPLVQQDFHSLHNKYRWGSNIYYYLSAIYSIHPTYIQEMLSDNRYNDEQILSAINFLKSIKSPFSLKTMLRAISGVGGSENGSWSVGSWLKGRDVLIIGTGLGTTKYINALCQFIKINKPIVFCLNANKIVPSELVDAYIACHETRILIELDSYKELTKPLVLPMSRVPKITQESFQDLKVLDYGLRVKEGECKITKEGCVLSSPLSLMYAICLSEAGEANKVLMAGFDGYAASDARQQNMVDILTQYNNRPESLELTAITPSSYPVDQVSLFSNI
jgi:4-hydroxy 2-oxovalerate aldolase